MKKNFNNIGWYKIEEDGLPKKDGIFFLYGNGGVGMGKFCELQNVFKTFNGNIYTEVTHYQPVIKPNEPLY